MPTSPTLSLSCRTLALAFAAIFAVSCGGGENPDLEAKEQTAVEQVIGKSKYQVLAGQETIVQEGKTVKGEGKVIFVDVFEKPAVAKNFVIDFQLEVGGSLSLIAFATNELTRGVTLQIERKDEGKPLTVNMIAGEDNYDISGKLTGFDPAKRIKMLVDIHNDHAPSTHFLIWDGEKPVGDTPKDTALVDDLLDEYGNGVRTGLTLNKAQVFNVEIRESLYEH